MARGFLRNPGFELGDTLWTKQTGWTIVNSGARSGGYCARCDASTTSAIYSSESFDVRPGCIVTFSAYLSGASATGGTAYVDLEWLDKDGSAIDTDNSTPIAHGSGYTLCSVTATAPGKAKKVRPRIAIASGNGSVWLADDSVISGDLIETIPSAGKIQSHRILQADTVASFDPLIGDKKFSEFNSGMSDRWAGVFNFIPLQKGGNLEGVLAFLTRIGVVDRFFAYDPDRRVPLNGVVNGLLVDGASQSGFEINVKGGDADSTPLVAGDYVEIADQYFELKRDLELGPLGTGILHVWPSLRSSPVDEEPIITNNPKMVARSTLRPERASGTRPITELSLSWMEAI